VKWKRAVEFHLDNAIEKFLDILKFPSGWLRECYDPMDEDETIHVGAVRRIIIRKVSFLYNWLCAHYNLTSSMK